MNYKHTTVSGILNQTNSKSSNLKKTLLCPYNGRIRSFQVHAGDLVDAIGFTCKDGNVVPPNGGLGGLEYNIDSIDTNGFTSFNLTSGLSVDAISFPEGVPNTKIGGRGGN